MWEKDDDGLTIFHFSTYTREKSNQWIDVEFKYHFWTGTSSLIDTSLDKTTLPIDVNDAEKWKKTDLHQHLLNDQRIQPTVERVLLQMLPGEEAVACMPVSLWNGSLPLDVDVEASKDTHIWLYIQLISADKNCIKNEMKNAIELKRKGGKLFALDEWKEAALCYKEALRWVLKCKDKLRGIEMKQNDDTITEVNQLRLTCHLNMASCHLNNKQPRRCISRCTRALEINPSSIKGLIRRSKGLLQLQLYDKALDDLKCARKIEPHNQVVLKCMKRAINRKSTATAAVLKTKISNAKCL